MSDEINKEATVEPSKVLPIDIVHEMKKSFIDYSMSVIVDRALPDVRDGLKPVHRRIIYSMYEQGYTPDKAYRKSATTVGNVMGKYHPHGDAAIYDSLVRLAQDFSMRYTLVDGNGNFGSRDGDPPAAQRYTEAKMSKISMEMVADINKNTVDFRPNYDEHEMEPSVLPARFPNMLVNGSSGIAVGMATNIPPHNLGETIDATLAIMDDPDITVSDLMENYIPGPDFPTGGIILGRSGIRQAYETGRGSIIIRSKVKIEEMDNGKKRIIVYEIPYQVNKATMIEKIASLVREKVIDGITYLNDESNRDGVRIVIELRKDVQEYVILNQLYRLTPLQTSFGINMLSLVNGAPKQMGIKETLQHYVDHQVEVTTRRTRFDLKKAEDRAHILEGFRIALDHIDAIIALIRASRNDEEAMQGLMEQFALSEVQAKAILQMQLRRLTGLERDKIETEYNELLATIADLRDILANESRIHEIIRQELSEVKEKYGDERRTEISDSGMEMDDEDLIPVEDVVITMSTSGYIKRAPVDTYKTQQRGGRGVKGMSLNEDDVIETLITMSTHDHLLMFTNLGRVYRLKGYNIPNASRTSKGLPVVNLLSLEKEEGVTALVPMKKDSPAQYLFFVTQKGLVKRVKIEDFDYIPRKGKLAIQLREDDELINVKLTSGEDEILIAGSNGKVIRFEEDEVRPMGRTASGVRGFNTDGGTVVGVAVSHEGKYLLSVSENGYGKRSEIDEYRKTNRGNKGVKTINVTTKTGSLVTVRAVNGDEDAMIVTDKGIIIRIALDHVGVYGRNTQGVKLINVADDETVTKVAVVAKNEEEQSEE